MFYRNPKSKRKNPFEKIYRGEKFNSVLKNRKKPVPFPFLIDIELTNHCNLNCLFCGQQTMKREKGFMSEEIFKKAIDECAKHKTPIRLIRWGEPFLHPEIIDFVKYAKSKGVFVHITNNGQAMRDEHMPGVVDFVDSLIFSFQGATKKEYEIMRNNNRYDNLKSRILKLVKLRGEKEKPYIHISSTMTNEPKKEIDKFVKYWSSIVDSVGIGKTNLSKLSFVQIKSFETIKNWII